MKARNLKLLLLLAMLLAIQPAHAVTNAVDAVPSATLLLPYFEVYYANEVAARHVFTVGNNANVETLVHVTLWTDRGVPTYSFDMRLAANGIQEIDLNSLFVNGTLPQTTAGSFVSCAATLPPANIPPATLAELQRAHRGQSSALLGGECGGVNYGQAIARGYVTVDVTRQCTTLFPGGPNYFLNGGLGIATNDNVIWGESHVTDGPRSASYGTPVVHIEASATDDMTDGVPGHCPPHATCPPSTPNTVPDYTFYRLRLGGSTADNREALPQQWRGRFDITDSQARPLNRTYAQVWRDPGFVESFPCGAPPANLTTHELVAFDDQEEVGTPGAVLEFPYATQKTQIAPSSFLPPGFLRGFLHYSLAGGTEPDVGGRRQSHVTHVYEGTGVAGASTAWPLTPITHENPIVLVFGGPQTSPCADGVDNDLDGLIDFPNDPGCRTAESLYENPQCSDGADNDGDTLADFPNDPQCHAAWDYYEQADFECDDGIDNDGDGQIDWLFDGGCTYWSDGSENSNTCSDGVDNDGDGLIDFPNDPGCGSPFSNTESPQCSDGIDNDGDGFTDFPNDPGCSSASSNVENPACSDGVDNDGDGLIDFPNDPGCSSRTSLTESPQCNDGNDNDGDGLIDFPNDAGCTSPSDPLELQYQCNDGIDNDGDGLIDFPNETGCSSPTDDNELGDCSDGEDNDCDGLADELDPGCANPLDPHEGTPTTRACRDGIDNDGDGLVDYPNDPGCSSAYDDVEFNEGATAQAVVGIPALSPFALVLMAALLAMVAAIALRGGIMS